MRDIVEKTLRTGDLPNSRGVAPHLNLVIGLDTLKGLDQATYGALVTGSALSPAAVRGWDIRLGPDGIPEMIPPKSIDPEQRPRRNTYWQIQRDLLKQ